MVATRGRTFKRPWRRSCHSSKLKSSSAPIGRKDSWCFHAVGSSNAPLLGSTAAEGSQRIGRTSIATRWRSCGLPQSASCSENFVIPPDVFGQTLSARRCLLRNGSVPRLLWHQRSFESITPFRSQGGVVMLTRAFAEKVVRLCTEKADFEDFQRHTAPCFVYEFMGTQPYAGEWHGANAVKRQFTVFNENFTSEFEVTATEIYVDSEKKTVAVRLQSHPLTDRGGGEYRQHCVWFVYFNDDNKITRIVDYSDTKLVDEMIIRVATAKMKALRYTPDARTPGTKSRVQVRAGHDETLHDH